MPRLKRKSLTDQVVLAITEEIAAGVWTKRLPGYRALGKRYDISRTTCDKALMVLEENGVIGPAMPGKTRAILWDKESKLSQASLQLLTVIDSFHPPTPLDEKLLSNILDFWRSEGGEVSQVQCDLMRSHNPGHILKKWLNTYSPDCLLFDTIPPKWVIPLEELGLPCYANGGSIVSDKKILSGSGFKIADCIKHILREVLELGHRRIQLVMGRATTENDMRRAIEQVTDPIIAEDWEGDEISFSIEVPDLVNPKDWHDWWGAMLKRNRPTLVVTECVFQTIFLNDFCLTSF